MIHQQTLNCLSAFAAFIAAALWFCSSVAKVKSDYKGDLDETVRFVNFHGGQGPIKIEKSGKRIDVNASIDLQSKFNAYAAIAAGVAAILQSIALGFPSA